MGTKMKYLKLFENNDNFVDVDDLVEKHYQEYFDKEKHNGDFDELLTLMKDADADHVTDIRDTIESYIYSDIEDHFQEHPLVNIHMLSQSTQSSWRDVMRELVEDSGAYTAVENEFKNEIEENEEWIIETLRNGIEEDPLRYFKLKKLREEDYVYEGFNQIIDDILDDPEFEHIIRSKKGGLLNLNK